MQERINFTKRWLDQLPPQDADATAREKEYSDSQVIGLKIQVNKNGRKFFYLRYSFLGRKKGIRIGEYGALNLTEARMLANTYKGQIAHGVDPQAEKEKKRSIPTLEQFVEREYLPHAHMSKKSARADESKLKHHILPTFKNRLITEISNQEVSRYHSRIKLSHCPATANRHLSLIHHLYQLAIQWGHAEENPAKGIKRFKENNERHRYLNQQELSAFLKALDYEVNVVAASAFAFLLFTGARKQEALEAKWEHINLEQQIWFLPDTKSGKSRHVILNPIALTLLSKIQRQPDNPYIFPGKVPGRPLNSPQKAFKRILKVAGIENFRIHLSTHIN